MNLWKQLLPGSAGHCHVLWQTHTHMHTHTLLQISTQKVYAQISKSHETVLNLPRLPYVCLLIMPLERWESSLFGSHRGKQPSPSQNIQDINRKENGSWISKMKKICFTQDHKDYKPWMHSKKLIKIDSVAYVHIIMYTASLLLIITLYLSLLAPIILKIARSILPHDFVFI